MKTPFFQVLGPNEDLNKQFIEKMTNKKYSLLNNFITTTKKEVNKEALKKYLILPDSVDNNIKNEWIEFYFQNNDLEWVKEF